MIIVLTGNDQQKKKKEIESLVVSHGGAHSFFTLSYDEHQPLEILQEVIHSEDIFGKPLLLKIDVEDFRKILDVVKNPITRFVDSRDLCFITASSLTKPEISFFQKHNAQIKEYILVKKKESPLVFALTDALIKKDKKNAWIVFQKIISQDISAEEIHGALWWQWKTLSLVSSKEKNLAKKTISPYVYSKSENSLKFFSEKEIQFGVSHLMHMLQESRRGKRNLLHQIELFILNQ